MPVGRPSHHHAGVTADTLRGNSLRKLLGVVAGFTLLALVMNSRSLTAVPGTDDGGGGNSHSRPKVTSWKRSRQPGPTPDNNGMGGADGGSPPSTDDDTPALGGGDGDGMGEPSGAPPAEVQIAVNNQGKRRGVVSSRYANGAANAAPPHSAVPFFGDSEGAVSSGTAQRFVDGGTPMPPPSDAVCWDAKGDATHVPAWATGMFQKLPSTAHFEALSEAADANEWSMIVAWVPGRFMGPQKDGKNAAGVVIKAPTKGRDPHFYLREYNASWHAAATVSPGSFDYHFQLLHRNALAVCIRERLHINAIRCSPNKKLPPMLLHHCTCRKCSEPIAHRVSAADRAQIGKIPGWSEATAHVPVMMPKALIEKHAAFLTKKPRVIAGYSGGKGGGAKAVALAKEQHKPYEGECVQAVSAPWLVDTQTIGKFAYEGLESDLDQLLAAQADKDGIVLVAMFNKFWVDHLHNFYFSMVRRGTVSNIIIATLDPEALAVCKANRLPCFDASDYAELEEDMVEGGAGYKAGHLRKVTEAMSWIKPRLAVAVIERGYGFFMVDLDMSWNGWPMRDIVDVGTDLTHQCDAPGQFSINSGYYLARPNARTWQFFRNLMVFNVEENSDQTAMKLFSRYDHTHGMSNACLDKWLFNMKCNYKKAGSVKVVKGKETFEWAAFDRNRTKFFWRILHATCISGAQLKILYLRTMNAWFLDDLDMLTSKKRSGGAGYCLLHPDGETVTRGHTATTVHSATYTTETDARFLQGRH